MKKIVSLIVLIIFVSCSSPTLNPEERKEMKELVQNPETVLVDVRTPKEYESNTAHNAVNIPLAQVENNLDFFRKQKNVVLFCNSGNQSNQALQILKKNGINNAHNAKTVKIVKSLQK